MLFIGFKPGDLGNIVNRYQLEFNNLVIPKHLFQPLIFDVDLYLANIIGYQEHYCILQKVFGPRRMALNLNVSSVLPL